MNEREELYKYYGKEYTDRLFDQEEYLINRFSSIIKDNTFSEERKIKECVKYCIHYVRTCNPVTVDQKHLQMRLIDNIEETSAFFLDLQLRIDKSINKQ